MSFLAKSESVAITKILDCKSYNYSQGYKCVKFVNSEAIASTHKEVFIDICWDIFRVEHFLNDVVSGDRSFLS